MEVFRFYADSLEYGFVIHSIGTTVNPLGLITKPKTDWESQKEASEAFGSKIVVTENDVEKLFRKAIKLIWK